MKCPDCGLELPRECFYADCDGEAAMTNVLIGILIGLGIGGVIAFALYYGFAKKVRW